LQDGFIPLALAKRKGHEWKIRAAIAQGQKTAALRGKRAAKGWGSNDPWEKDGQNVTNQPNRVQEETASDSTTRAAADSQPRPVEAGRGLLDFTNAYTVKKGARVSLDSHARTLKGGVTYVQMRLLTESNKPRESAGQKRILVRASKDLQF
jgi:hypothetical protein